MELIGIDQMELIGIDQMELIGIDQMELIGIDQMELTPRLIQNNGNIARSHYRSNI